MKGAVYGTMGGLGRCSAPSHLFLPLALPLLAGLHLPWPGSDHNHPRRPQAVGARTLWGGSKARRKERPARRHAMPKQRTMREVRLQHTRTHVRAPTQSALGRAKWAGPATEEERKSLAGQRSSHHERLGLGSKKRQITACRRSSIRIPLFLPSFPSPPPCLPCLPCPAVSALRFARPEDEESNRKLQKRVYLSVPAFQLGWLS